MELSGNNWRVLVGDVMARLADIADGSVQCCVTSPPYWNLRDYGTGTWEGGDEGCDHETPMPNANERTFSNGRGEVGDDWSGKSLTSWTHRDATTKPKSVCGKCGARRIDRQIGLEPTIEAFVEKMVAVFREVRRVLHPTGCAFINLGDSYTSQGGTGQGRHWDGREKNFETQSHRMTPCSSLKPKDLCGIPWRVALALQADGWWLRSDIPWVKRSAMPESVTDRPAKALEYVFMLTKSPTYYFDMEAVRREYRPNSWDQMDGQCSAKPGFSGNPRCVGDKGHPLPGSPSGRNFRNADLWFDSIDEPHGLTGFGDELVGLDVTTESFGEAHFATFPSRLVTPLIKAGTSERGCCPYCLSPWRRVTEKRKVRRERPNELTKRTGENGTGNHCANTVAGVAVETKGWEPSCDCEPHEPIPCTVLDCFSGSGTTGMVATELGRSYLGIELNPEYAEMSRRRIESWKRRDMPKPVASLAGQKEMF